MLKCRAAAVRSLMFVLGLVCGCEGTTTRGPTSSAIMDAGPGRSSGRVTTVPSSGSAAAAAAAGPGPKGGAATSSDGGAQVDAGSDEVSSIEEVDRSQASGPDASPGMLASASLDAGQQADGPATTLADARGLARLSDWHSLPRLGDGKRYRQQTSRERGATPLAATGLARDGNRDFNNFHCASDDATIAAAQVWPLRFRQEHCEEDYVRGAVMARFVGQGRHVRSWIGMASLLFAPSDDEILRFYIDDDPTPRIEVLLRTALESSNGGDIFARPFGSQSVRRMSWYYPIAYKRKLVVALDHLGENDAYFYHYDVVQNDSSSNDGEGRGLDALQEAATSQLQRLEEPAGALAPLLPRQDVRLPVSAQREFVLDGPATLHEIRVWIPAAAYDKLAAIRLRLSWEAEAAPAISLALRDLFGGGEVPPEGTSSGVTSRQEDGGGLVLAFKLPMPFERQARLRLDNAGADDFSMELALLGLKTLPLAPFGHLHAQRVETVGPTTAAQHTAVDVTGGGRLVGVCGYIEGHADPELFLEASPFNMLEGDVTAIIDGEIALDGTGTEEYADDVFYFKDAPHRNAFVHAWGVVADVEGSIGSASFCRWHVLGTELDFSESLRLAFELGGSRNPGIVERIRTIAFLYR